VIANKIFLIAVFIIGAISANAEGGQELWKSKFVISDVKFVVNNKNVFYYSDGKKIAASTILNGGWWSPHPYISMEGKITLGQRIFNNKTKKFEKKSYSHEHFTMLSPDIKVASNKKHSVVSYYLTEKKPLRCIVNFDKAEYAEDTAYSRIKNGAIQAVSGSGNEIGFLYELKKNENDNVSHYIFNLVNIKNCSFHEFNIPDDDFYSSLGWNNNGGWWIVGSIEQSLLNSLDGKKWNSISLPKGIYALTDAYFESPSKIWLSGGIAEITKDDDPMLLYSDNSGRNWINISKQSPLLIKMPKYWIQGHNQANYDAK